MSTPAEVAQQALALAGENDPIPPSWILHQARMWWRPAACWVVIFTVAVNGIALPLLKRPSLDLIQLAALIGALIPFVAARSWEKVRGVQ